MMIKDNKPIYEQQQQQTQDDSVRASVSKSVYITSFLFNIILLRWNLCMKNY